MAYWLLKTEPDCYAWPEMARDKETVWDGVANALALKNIRSMKPGDEAFFYHTGKEKCVVGVVRITSAPYVDPKGDDDRLAVVDVAAVRQLSREVPLSELKADPAFVGWDLLRISRLSIVPVPEKMWKHVLKISEMAVTGTSERKRTSK